MTASLKRHDEVDLYKGIGIILTVTALTGMLNNALQYRFNAVCFPVFMIAAGVTARNGKYEAGEKAVMAEGIKKIILPYFWFSLIYLLIDAAGMFVLPSVYDLQRIYKDIWDSISFVGISVLWFLPAYFLAVCGYRIFRHYFKALPMFILLLAVALSITGILYFRGYLGLFDGGETDISIQSYGMRIALLFWRGSVGMFFCACGDALAVLADKLRERKLLTVLISVLLTGAGVGLSFLGKWCDYENMLVGNPFVSIPVSVFMAGGLFLLCVWIGTVRPLDFLGRHAIIIYVSVCGFGIMKLSLYLGNKVFISTVNNFANRATVAVCILVMELIVILLLRNKIFSFLFGDRDFTMPETEEEVF
ncbi:MAG: hypothetical protein J6X66_07645 [Lachnospiraceae bacterium]|nr:hypothetical protein [Lachnospiraceae bacterium]